MRKFVLSLAALAYCLSAQAEITDLSEFGKSYFSAWAATQSPNATQSDLEHYLSFLADDVGHQHLPYASDDSRHPSGKADMRKGMLVYLGAHSEYSAQLHQVIPAHNAVVITYSTSSSGIHPQTKKEVKLNYDTMEVLEIEEGKVSVIRKYED